VAPDGSVYVVDYGNNRIQKFTSEGVFINKWDTDLFPNNIAIAYYGSVYVLTKQIEKFTSEGVFISQLGTLGPFDNQTDWPDAITVASDGSVYVADTSNARIQRFTSDGMLISKWSTCCSLQPELDSPVGDHPTGIAVAPDGSFYVADQKYHRIQKFSVEQ